MKKLPLLALTLAAFLSSCGPGRNSNTKLSENGTTAYAIVTAPADVATPAEQFAAGELALFLKKITGADFPIVAEGAHSGPGIFIGLTQRAASLGIDFAQLGDEEWVLRTDGQDLVFAGGRPRGTLYAVYEFLESQAGCRWVTHDIEVIPPNPDFSIPPMDERGKPGFSWRETTLYPRHDDPKRIPKEDYALFLVRNRYNGGPFWTAEPRFGFAVRFGSPGFAHTSQAYQDQLKDVKPEYLAMTEEGTRAPRSVGALGHDLCLTNPEVRELIFQQLLQYIEQDRKVAAEKGMPAPTIYAISQNDTSSKYCRCPECMAIADREGSYSGTMIDFINSIADRVAGVYPDVKVLTEAYQYTQRPPKSIRPRQNVIIRLALLDLEYRAAEIADVLRPITSTTNQAAREVTESWARTISGSQMFIWDYAQIRTLFRHPYDATTKILKNLEFWHRLGIERVFLEQAGLDLSFRPMRDWLFFRKSVHPETDNQVLIREFLEAYFGPAVGPMRKYYELLAAETEAGDKPYFETPASVNPYLTPEFFTQINAWLDEAEALAQGQTNEKFLRHVQRERIPLDSAMLYLWHRYADSPAWSGRKEEVLRRYEKNKRDLVQTYTTDVDVWVASGAKAFEGELVLLRMEPPARFAGRSANIRFASRNDAPAANIVKDPAATDGHARSLGRGKPEDHKLPFHLKLHDDTLNKSWKTMVLETVPQDEAYHWHLVDTVPLAGNCGIWSNVYTWIPVGWGAVPPPSNEMEVWVLMKFTGPTYVAGSTQPDQVLIDQIVIVPPER